MDTNAGAGSQKKSKAPSSKAKKSAKPAWAMTEK